MERTKEFALSDLVTWSEEELGCNFHSGLVERYGKGPFTVAGLRLKLSTESGSHPVVVKIQLSPEGREKYFEEYPGEWFKKTAE